MTSASTLPARWRKSTYSSPNGGECLEVGDGLPVVPVRDSKHPHGPALVFEPSAWASFIAAVRRDDLRAV